MIASYLAGLCFENSQSYLTFLSLVDVHTRLLHEIFCILLDLFMSKIYLKWAGVYMKIIALMVMLMPSTDMFHTFSILKPGAQEGAGAGRRYTEKKKYFFHQSH